MIGRDAHRARGSAELGDRRRTRSSTRRRFGRRRDGLPQVTEIGVRGARRDERRAGGSSAGVNWSAAWVEPVPAARRVRAQPRLRAGRTRSPSSSEPIVLLVHVAHPRVQYADRGEVARCVSSMDSDADPRRPQRRHEEVDAAAQGRGAQRTAPSPTRVDAVAGPARTSLKDICYERMHGDLGEGVRRRPAADALAADLLRRPPARRRAPRRRTGR